MAEDIELNQQIVRHIIESWGCEVTLAPNGHEAVKKLQQADYDLILMDIQMPEMDGVQATLAIRSLPDALKAAIPIVAFTAHTLKQDSAKYIAAGMNDYLSKPFEEEKLYEMIARHLLPFGAQVAGSLPEEAPDVPDAPAAEKLFDLSLIEAISGGDKDFIRQMIDLFIETVPANVQEMNDCLARENWDGVNKVAHKLKSILDSMGINSVKQDVRTLEMLAKNRQDLSQLPALAGKVTATVQTCVLQLEKEMVAL